MITLNKTYANEIDYNLLERLFQEAYPYISEERKRMGDNELRSALLDDLQDYPIIRYDVDGYTVGICSYSEMPYNGQRYFYHRHPLYGCDASGSKSWWFSEEFQQKNSEYVSSEGFAGMISLFNPASRAGQAVLRHFGTFDKYYSRPIIIDNPEEIGFKLKPDALGLMKAFVLNVI